MPIDPHRWERVEALFHRALDLPEHERESFLAREAGDDPALAADVLAMLAEDRRRDTPVDRDLGALAGAVLDTGRHAPATIGPYTIIEVLGRGGMGVVYLARRDGLDRLVALKMVGDALLSPYRRARFAREAQTLAQLDHPSIARLYDADALPDGTPYIVMEYVDGVPVTDHCKARQASLTERLRLFGEICQAVRYAHQHAVIHRDLKPSNVLVTKDGAVRLLDFGIAKQLESIEAPAPQTEPIRLMTAAYAAPEQLRGEPIGIYSDVYALGVLLYELLTDRHPFDLEGLTAGQIEQRVTEQEPVKPSVVARAAPTSADRIGAASWAELDVLCLTAMHKDPARRYGSVDALLADLARFARGEPLAARADSLGYRTGKFVRRHRRPLAAAAVVGMAIIALTVFYTLRLADARDAALAAAQRAERIQRFTLSLFEGGGGGTAPAESLRVVTLLDQGVRDALLLQDEPELQSEVLHTLGTVFQELGELDRADSLLQAALDTRAALHSADHPDVARSTMALGLLRAEQARYEDAERLTREAVATMRRAWPDGHPAIAEAVTALGKVLIARGEYTQAIELLEAAVRMHAAYDSLSVPLSETLNQLANAHFYAGNYAASDSLNRLTLNVDRELFGPRHPNVADALINLGAVQFQLGDHQASERFYREALGIMRDHYGEDHAETASTMMMLGQSLAHQERLEEALEVLQPALAVRERVYGSDHPRVANTLNEIGTVALRQERLAAAESSFARMVEIYRRAYDDDHYLIGIALSNLASVYSAAEDHRRAERTLREAVRRLSETLSPDHPNTAVARIKLGDVLVRQGRLADAKEPLRSGYDVLAERAAPSSRWLRTARERLAEVYAAEGQAEVAARFRTELAAAPSGN